MVTLVLSKWSYCIKLSWSTTALILSSTPCVRFELIQFSVLQRSHLSKSRLSKIYPNIADQCNRCHASSCNLRHMFFFLSWITESSKWILLSCKVLWYCGPIMMRFRLSVDINCIQSDISLYISSCKMQYLSFMEVPQPPSPSGLEMLWVFLN